MIISHQYRFIFVKTGKTAGTSIEVYLSPLCGIQDIVTPIYPHVHPHKARNYESKKYRNHMPAREIKDLIGDETWRQYYKFCVERNPWDKTLSHYSMLNFRAEGKLSLDEYFENGRFCSNFGAYTDTSGELLVDKILRYEDLSMELAEVFGSLAVPFNGDLRVRAKGDYRMDRRHYSEVLSTEQAETIAKVFQREIELLGYRY